MSTPTPTPTPTRTPAETVALFRRQVRQRLTWLLATAVIGAFVALAFWLFDLHAEPWRPGLLAHGILFWPWFYRHVHSKDHVSTAEAISTLRAGLRFS